VSSQYGRRDETCPFSTGRAGGLRDPDLLRRRGRRLLLLLAVHCSAASARQRARRLRARALERGPGGVEPEVGDPLRRLVRGKGRGVSA
jgi:hypothetical protein